ncbi:hypothetical protein SKAU_G00124180 [Synaphobranchus kaupii]|uniref:Uncharacterized protein n=1 Tax=Synaphobranchus kaupii TaxID=118154 RepID=A0A9Q1J0K6_SYNKA|nr:hypothetical protein SKAU_G00124180 [Synaphobranchus kaupii]
MEKSQVGTFVKLHQTTRKKNRTERDRMSKQTNVSYLLVIKHRLRRHQVLQGTDDSEVMAGVPCSQGLCSEDVP